MSGISINSVYLTNLYNYFFEEKLNEKNNYKTNNFNHHNTYKKLYCDKIIKKKNIKTNFKNTHKNKFNKCLKDIKNKNNIIYWVYNNNAKKLLKYKIVILDFQTIYDYKNEQALNMKYLKYLSKYLLDNKIIFCIISEINPKFFPKIDYFNPINLITPYHYKNRSFGGVVKIGINKYNNKSVNVNVNKLINDIMNQYGCNDKEIVYINSKKIEKVNTIII
jgi:hypothetical protein